MLSYAFAEVFLMSDYFGERYVLLTSLFIPQTDGICPKLLPKSAEELGWNLCLLTPNKKNYPQVSFQTQTGFNEDKWKP